MNVSTNLPRLTAGLLLATCVVPAAAQSGESKSSERMADHRARHIVASDLIGSDVVLLPSREARREAQRDGETADAPECSLTDVVVDAKTGNLEFAVLEVGDKYVAVPCKALQWEQKAAGDDDAPRLHLMATEQDLASQPAFDLDAAKENGLEAAVAAVRTSAIGIGRLGADGVGHRDAVDASAKTGKENGEEAGRKNTAGRDGAVVVVRETTVIGVPMPMILGSQLTGTAVRTTDEKFGSIDKCLIDCKAMQLDYVVIGHGGVVGIGETDYLVPLAAVSLSRDAEGERTAHLPVTAARMESAEKYADPDGDAVLDPAAADRACKFFGSDNAQRAADRAAPLRDRK